MSVHYIERRIKYIYHVSMSREKEYFHVSTSYGDRRIMDEVSVFLGT
jgi:hypothetical protein